jgi:ABC-type sulfate transport system substrate-binding protein
VLTMCENVAPEICQERTKVYTDHWKKLMGERAAVYSHYGTKKSALDVVAGLGVIE